MDTNPPFLRRTQAKCSACGGKIEIPETNAITILKCKFCNSTYEYNPATQIAPSLIFEDGEKGRHRITMVDNIVICRGSGKGYMCIVCEADQSLIQYIPIRNRFVSRKRHVKINVKPEFKFLSNEKSAKIVSRKKCLIQDCSSTNGTSVNGHMLNPDESKELRNDDLIILAPLSPMPLKILFKETILTN